MEGRQSLRVCPHIIVAQYLASVQLWPHGKLEDILAGNIGIFGHYFLGYKIRAFSGRKS